MKKIINKKVYDTETAKLLGEYDNGCLPSDFNYIRERLYQKRTGEYFLLGEGGPRTEYCNVQGSSWGWGFEIIPFSALEALDWAEENLSADEYIKVFGRPQE